MGIERYSVLSVSPVQFSVFADRNGAVYNPTGATFQVAFLTHAGDPVDTDWRAGTWETSIIGTYVGQVKIGPGTTAILGRGEYYTWTKIIDVALGETDVRQVGKIIVY